jgi:hypothetical protein
MKRRFIVALVALALVGCAHGPGGPTRLEVWQARCSEYGFQPGTDAHASCVQQEALAYRARVQAGAAANRSVTCTPNIGVGGFTCN